MYVQISMSLERLGSFAGNSLSFSAVLSLWG